MRIFTNVFIILSIFLSYSPSSFSMGATLNKNKGLATIFGASASLGVVSLIAKTAVGSTVIPTALRPLLTNKYTTLASVGILTISGVILGKKYLKYKKETNQKKALINELENNNHATILKNAKHALDKPLFLIKGENTLSPILDKLMLIPSCITVHYSPISYQWEPSSSSNCSEDTLDQLLKKKEKDFLLLIHINTAINIYLENLKKSIELHKKEFSFPVILYGDPIKVALFKKILDDPMPSYYKEIDIDNLDEDLPDDFKELLTSEKEN